VNGRWRWAVASSSRIIPGTEVRTFGGLVQGPPFANCVPQGVPISPAGHGATDWIMEQRVSLITLGVADLRRARSFYEALGWSGAHQPDDEVCFFQAGAMVFGL